MSATALWNDEAAPSVERVDAAACAAMDALLSWQKPDFHWCAELQSNPTVTAEYVMMRQAHGLDLQTHGESLKRWLLTQQKQDGSFGVAYNSPGDISTTCEVYLALKILGLNPEHPAMQQARAYVLHAGGLANVRIFTRIFFAMFGLFDWRDVPALPPELILLPRTSPINIYKFASWARGTVVPLLIIWHHRPIFALPNGRHRRNTFTDELWVGAAHRRVPYCPSVRNLWREHGIGWPLFFALTDALLQAYEPRRVARLRRYALRKCTAWILERQESSGDWAGIFPPMLNNLLALPLQGYAVGTDPMQRGLAAMEGFAWQDGDGRRIQACVSPLWDTVLSLIACCDNGAQPDDPRLRGAARWLLRRQISHRRGDWSVSRPKLTPGGWSFEYHNTWYPDVDDTAAVLIALLKHDPRCSTHASVLQAVNWMLGMQNRDGGWAAFDADNDALFLNDAPFADMKAMCDPSTADVTGRIIEALGLLHTQTNHGALLPSPLRHRIDAACAAGVAFLRRTQTSFGGWFGRWGVNYIYGTSHVLCGLSRLPGGAPADLCAAACGWLKGVQNRDGGWGETLATYHDVRLAGHGSSTASQTAWALMALLAHLPARDPAITRGIDYLMVRQQNGTWQEPETTATGFPGHFYVRYDLYRHYFPLMALGRYRRALRQTTTRG